MKKICAVLLLTTAVLGYYLYKSERENDLLAVENVAVLLKVWNQEQQLKELERRPTYEQGQKDTLIKLGAPDGPSAFRDGYDLAVSLYANAGYSEGYHQAIFQFGYQPVNTSQYLVPEPSPSEKKEEQATAK